MLRSRSSFEDLAAAIASASSLEPARPASPIGARGAPLVSFTLDPAADPTPPERFPTEAEIAVVRAAAPRAPESARLDEAASSSDGARRPP